ncbi:hypothetical protein [Arcticibacter tournemirensis]|uniref:Uncharacterized protein n=1 Tax=Arcticibacter tournemirensis TaxID=699437 RepID=A0A4Q0MB74_9SPHI|nr:hypothetical protein [Arcticibacter tournemirensis]RXF70375.1 hypothetical protein EKH83_06910 [Arcticibacter tournemirensis]
MIIEFLYRYYYTFFVKHLKDEELGKSKGPAWFFTIAQITVAVGTLMLGVIALLLHCLGLFNYLKGLNKIFSIFLIVIVPFALLYYLLFKYYHVSKRTGKTPRSDYQISRGWNLFFWFFWVFSVLLPFWVALIGNNVL